MDQLVGDLSGVHQSLRTRPAALQDLDEGPVCVGAAWLSPKPPQAPQPTRWAVTIRPCSQLLARCVCEALVQACCGCRRLPSEGCA